jgi:hypothetical protein
VNVRNQSFSVILKMAVVIVENISIMFIVLVAVLVKQDNGKKAKYIKIMGV